jgi:hypothetical protein
MDGAANIPEGMREINPAEKLFSKSVAMASLPRSPRSTENSFT